MIGFASNGVHANGFTIARRILGVEDYAGPDLLAPTRLYLAEARALHGRAKAYAHITGGGLLGNLSRVLPEGRLAEIDWDSWTRPPVFAWLARHVEEDELRRDFNHGIGWCAVVAEPGANPLDRQRAKAERRAPRRQARRIHYRLHRRGDDPARRRGARNQVVAGRIKYQRLARRLCRGRQRQRRRQIGWVGLDCISRLLLDLLQLHHGQVVDRLAC